MNTVTRTLRALSVARAAAVACAMLTSAVANATDAVQWRVEDGGNGHWYQVTVSELIGNSWVTARAMAQGLGGDLATFGTLTEWNHVTSNVIAGDTAGPNPQTMYLGGRKIDNDWGWADGSPWPSNPPWFQPGICPGVAAPNGDGTVLQSFCFGLFWDDRPEVGGGALNKALIEWSADCNNDGLVDYGQILSGQLADADANGVPDICETLRVPQEYATIQAAVDAAVNGNTVLVGPGTYAPFDIAGKSIAIRSTQGAAATIIDGSGQGRSTVVFGIGTTLRTTLAGFTVRCGMGTGAYWY
ncbi:MAG: leupeptin-inactivating enzyme 1, partial [Planctomycetota bacterium]